MTLLKRLKNLWNLSEWEIPKKNSEQTAQVGDKFSMLFKPTEKPKMAQIIKRSNPTEDFLKEPNE